MKSYKNCYISDNKLEFIYFLTTKTLHFYKMSKHQFNHLQSGSWGLNTKERQFDLGGVSINEAELSKRESGRSRYSVLAQPTQTYTCDTGTNCLGYRHNLQDTLHAKSFKHTCTAQHLLFKIFPNIYTVFYWVSCYLQLNIYINTIARERHICAGQSNPTDCRENYNFTH